MKSVETDHQSTEPRRPLRHRGNMIKPKVTAPEIILTDVKLAASMSCCPNASRQINGLAAKAIIAITVRDLVFATALPNCIDPKLVTLQWRSLGFRVRFE